MEPASIALGIGVGCVGLAAGGELLVRGASALAAALKVPPLVIGLTVVALGTSSPEVAVSVFSAAKGETDLAVGNAVGSNLANLLLILGVAAVVTPLSVHTQLFRLDIPVMIATAGVLWAMASDGALSRGEGLALLIGSALYLAWTVYEGRREARRLETEIAPRAAPSKGSPAGLALAVACIAAGLALLVFGADSLVAACTRLAERLGVSPLVIGLTVVALGTSLPELVVTVLASVRGKRDLAVGNVVGSNILNVLVVLGLAAAVAPGGLAVQPASLRMDLPLLAAVSAACYPLFLTGGGVRRGEGVGMVAYYAAYVAWLAWSSTEADPPTNLALAGFLALLAAAIVGTLWVSRGAGAKQPA